MELGHGSVIHAVEVIARQDEHIFGAGGANFVELLAHGIGSALVPVFAGDGLLRRPDLHPAEVEGIKLVGAGDMPVQRHRVELRQHGNVEDARVDAVADGNINEPVLARNWHGRLRAHFGQRVQAGAAPTAQNHSQHIIQR